MLKDRILLTLRFFDELQTAVTLEELHKFLFNEAEALNFDPKTYEVSSDISLPEKVSVNQISDVLKTELADQIEMQGGLICLRARNFLIKDRLNNLVYQQHREKLISRFLPMLRYLPFVRGVAVGGSHTLGPNRKESDIDLLIIVDENFLWLSRILITAYFQLTGHRRYSTKIANRFCLNHYLAGPRIVDRERDPYNAMEYLRLVGKIYPQQIAAFIQNNLFWIRNFFPNYELAEITNQRRSYIQLILEILFRNPLGRLLNRKLGQWQLRRINPQEAAIVSEKELSFHSIPRKSAFLAKVFAKASVLQSLR
jgi:predicted nucleotidyltransferase